MIIVKTDASVQDSHNAGIGWEIEIAGINNGYLQNGIITGHDVLDGEYTSMEAEFLALFRGLKEALRLGERDTIKLFTDCQPVVEKVKNHVPILDGSYVSTFHWLLERVDYWDVQWCSRDRNRTADREAHVALDKCRQA